MTRENKKMTVNEVEQIVTLIDFYRYSVNYNRFNYCQAYISEVVFNSAYGVTFQLIKSYDTIVGFVNHNTKEYIELGKWSHTTSKQVTQIHNQRFNDYKRFYFDLQKARQLIML